MKSTSNEKEKTTYSCKGLVIGGDCSKNPKKECIKDLGTCLKSNSGSNGRPIVRATTPAPQKEFKFDEMIVNLSLIHI